MRCSDPGGALWRAQFARYLSSTSCSPCRIPKLNDEASSFRYQLLPTLISLSLAQKKVCGGGKAAIAPPRVSATTKRFAARSTT